MLGMLCEVSRALYRRVRIWMLIVSTLVFAIFLMGVLPNEAARSSAVIGELPSPDTSLVYSAADLYGMAEAYGPEGRAYYVRSRYTFDVVWPLAYAAFLVTALTVVYRRLELPSIAYLVNLLPLMAADFDFLENLCAGVFMYRYPRATPFLAAVAPVATLSKWLLIGLSFAALVAGIAMLFATGLRKQS